MIKQTALFMCLSLSQVHALDIIEPAFGLWGIGGAYKDSPYQDQSPKYGINPYIFGGYGILNIEANRANISLYTNGSDLDIAVVAQLRTHQSSTNDDLEDRDNAIEAGLQLSYFLGAGFASRFTYLQDISNKHKANELELQVYRHDDIGDLVILSSMSLQRESQGLLNYYYGTDVYTPKAGLAGELEMILTYPVGDWAIFAGVRHYLYDSQVNNSPLISSNTITQGFMGFGYQF